MAGMPSIIDWNEIVLRLALTVVAGAVLGYNRTEQGKAAGLRTTLLVCLAASAAMIQVNLLLPTAGRPMDSFVMNDLMRLPLGILTGVGFIGGGVILRRENILVGVTTAATLWLATVVGLCFGGGQLGLGAAATAIGLAVLWPMAWLEIRLPRERGAEITVALEDGALSEQELRRQIGDAGFSIVGSRVAFDAAAGHREFVFQLRHPRIAPGAIPNVLHALTGAPGVARVVWRGPI